MGSTRRNRVEPIRYGFVGPIFTGAKSVSLLDPSRYGILDRLRVNGIAHSRMDAVAGKFIGMSGNGLVPINQNDGIGMRRRKIFQYLVCSLDPRHRCVRVDEHQHPIRSDIIQQIIELVIRHHGIGGKTYQHPRA